MKSHNGIAPVPLFEALESRECLSAGGGTEAVAPAAASPRTRHHAHHLHTLHHQHTLQTAHVQRREAHHTHHVHFLHTQHRAHVLRTTVPAPLVLTAQERNDWPAIRDEVLANRGRVKI